MKSKGYLLLTNPEGKKEFDTMTCGHCNGIVIMAPAPSGYCGNCNSILCNQCDSIGRCFPFEEWLDSVEKKAYRASQLTRLGIV